MQILYDQGQETVLTPALDTGNLEPYYCQAINREEDESCMCHALARESQLILICQALSYVCCESRFSSYNLYIGAIGLLGHFVCASWKQPASQNSYSLGHRNWSTLSEFLQLSLLQLL